MAVIDIEKLKASFNDDGYIVVKNLFSEAEMLSLLKEIEVAECVETISSPAKTLSKGTMIFRSNLFYNSKKIQDFISQQKIIDLLKNFAGNNIWARWDQAVGKGPNSATFPWHQDNGYSRLPHQYFQLWIAVTKSTAENGTLLISPGSHTLGHLPHKLDGTHLHYDGEVANPIMIEAEQGDAIIFSSFTLHATMPNITRNDTRWAYVIEYISLDHYDPTVPCPYFVVARNGKSTQEFIKKHPNLKLRDKVKHKLQSAKKKLKNLLKPS
ncbi:MAG: phytanoyl-CoA dioxygenase family protein, partial [Betaproteobacteria bacterium HGW-Betaproteobacteria-20]